MTKSVLIVTDAWRPQVNGVVMCLEAVRDQLVDRGVNVQFLTPNGFPGQDLRRKARDGLRDTTWARAAGAGQSASAAHSSSWRADARAAGRCAKIRGDG